MSSVSLKSPERKYQNASFMYFLKIKKAHLNRKLATLRINQFGKKLSSTLKL